MLNLISAGRITVVGDEPENCGVVGILNDEVERGRGRAVVGEQGLFLTALFLVLHISVGFYIYLQYVMGIFQQYILHPLVVSDESFSFSVSIN